MRRLGAIMLLASGCVMSAGAQTQMFQELEALLLKLQDVQSLSKDLADSMQSLAHDVTRLSEVQSRAIKKRCDAFAKGKVSDTLAIRLRKACEGFNGFEGEVRQAINAAQALTVGYADALRTASGSLNGLSGKLIEVQKPMEGIPVEALKRLANLEAQLRSTATSAGNASSLVASVSGSLSSQLSTPEDGFIYSMQRSRLRCMAGKGALALELDKLEKDKTPENALQRYRAKLAFTKLSDGPCSELSGAVLDVSDFPLARAKQEEARQQTWAEADKASSELGKVATSLTTTADEVHKALGGLKDRPDPGMTRSASRWAMPRASMSGGFPPEPPRVTPVPTIPKANPSNPAKAVYSDPAGVSQTGGACPGGDWIADVDVWRTGANYRLGFRVFAGSTRGVVLANKVQSVVISVSCTLTGINMVDSSNNTVDLTVANHEYRVAAGSDFFGFQTPSGGLVFRDASAAPEAGSTACQVTAGVWAVSGKSPPTGAGADGVFMRTITLDLNPKEGQGKLSQEVYAPGTPTAAVLKTMCKGPSITAYFKVEGGDPGLVVLSQDLHGDLTVKEFKPCAAYSDVQLATDTVFKKIP